MKKLTHKSAEASHYNQEAPHYDDFNENNSKIINRTIESVLKKHNVKSVLDLTCGTGSQVFWLATRGYEVAGYDINAKMLSIARKKAKAAKHPVAFHKGDVRTTQAGTFDAVVTIFNAVGHLTRKDFSEAMRNIWKNLNPGGLYIFDNFNLNYLLHKDNITKLTIDRLIKNKDSVIREIQYSTIDKSGILASYDHYFQQRGNTKPKISNAAQTLQVYDLKELKGMLNQAGFEVLRCCEVDGSRFKDKGSERMFVIAKKV